MDFGFTAIPAIAVICYAVSEAVKAIGVNPKWLPALCLALGGVLGAVGMIVMPDFPAGDFITALALGIVSGGAATTAHQTVKQLTSKEG